SPWKRSLNAARDRHHGAIRLFNRDTWTKAAEDRIRRVIEIGGQLDSCQAQCRPKTSARVLGRPFRRKRESRRHHANDLVRLTVKLHGPADYGRIRAITALPQRVAEKDHPRAKAVLVFGKDPAFQWRGAKH